MVFRHVIGLMFLGFLVSVVLGKKYVTPLESHFGLFEVIQKCQMVIMPI